LVQADWYFLTVALEDFYHALSVDLKRAVLLKLQILRDQDASIAGKSEIRLAKPRSVRVMFGGRWT
jgi:hypothetical protein